MAATRDGSSAAECLTLPPPVSSEEDGRIDFMTNKSRTWTVKKVEDFGREFYDVVADGDERACRTEDEEFAGIIADLLEASFQDEGILQRFREQLDQRGDE